MAMAGPNFAIQASGPMGVARWSLRLRIFLFFAFLAVGGVGAIAASSYYGFQRLDPASAQEAFMLVAILASFTIVGLTTWVWFLFDENVAKPLVALAGDLRSRAHANVAEAIDAAQARYLGDLAPAASAVSSHLADSRAGLDAAIERERERMLEEHNRLDAILRDTPTGCLLCNRAHRIALYNKAALDQLGDTGLELGLGRSVFDYFAEGPLTDALGRLASHNQADATELLCTTKDGGRSFQAEMRLFDGDGGYLLTFRDVTRDLAAHGRREALLRDVFDQLQRPAANLLTTIEALRTTEAAVPETRARLQSAVIAETRSLTQSVIALRERYEATAGGWWPMAETPAGDLLTSVQRRLAAQGATIEVEASPLSARCDGYAISRLLGDVAMDVATRDGAEGLRLEAVEAADDCLITLTWTGAPLPVGELEARLDAPLGEDHLGFTARDALRSHRSDIWPEAAAQGKERLCLPLSKALRSEQAPTPKRAVFHDLRLLNEGDRGALRDLGSLDYVVFDTETTGLFPDRGDEIVQIAAVRIVSGRLLTDDRFETFVNPGRAIPAASTEIHGVTNEMVATAPNIDDAGRRFHQFCGDSVLIAHNAPFDLAFLERHKDGIGATFTQDTLDTALMSAILFGAAADHSLDAIAERLGAPIDDAVRHTALGDAVATAEVAQRMIAMLGARGVRVMSDYQIAAKPHLKMLAS